MKEAQARIVPYIRAGETETVTLLDSIGRRLAEAIQATAPVPHFRRSGMDGFAVRAEDTKGATRTAPVLLDVIETIPGGTVPEKSVQQGTCSRIMTGAAVPDGADAVIMLEMTDEVEKDGKLYTTVKKRDTSVRERFGNRVRSSVRNPAHGSVEEGKRRRGGTSRYFRLPQSKGI
ncbi:MAG: hypothetical protein RBR24_01235 [Candidatus Carbobacillus sp.]|nr:hypothetical protein [Candidatus Carbobacillus sp.]